MRTYLLCVEKMGMCVEGIYRVRKKRVYATIFMMCTEKENKGQN